MGARIAERMRTLAALADEAETKGFEVSAVDVEPVGNDILGEVVVERDLIGDDLDAGVAVDIADARVTGDGDLRIELSVGNADRDEDEAAEGGEPSDAVDDGDSGGDADSEPRDDERAEATADDNDASRPAADDEDAASRPTDDGDTPAYRDPDELATVYDPEKTFAEMTEALDVDVTTQTVRKYMIEHGIHDPTPQPSSENLSERIDGQSADEPGEGSASPDGDNPDDRDETGEGDAESDASVTTEEAGESDDGEAGETHDSAVDVHAVDADGDPRDDGTPSTDATTDGGTLTHTTDDGTTTARLDGQRTLSEAGVDAAVSVTVDELVDAVVGARTLYDVERALDCDRETARTLLTECDLLGVVRGRAAAGTGATEAAVLNRLDDALGADATQSPN